MKRLSEVKVKAYRGLRDVSVEGMVDINVLIGPSNTGKTSLLEAVWLAVNPIRMADQLREILQSRGFSGQASLRSLFPDLDSANPIEIRLSSVDVESPVSATVTLRLPNARDARYTELLSQKGLSPDEFWYIDVDANTAGGEKPSSMKSQIGVRSTSGHVDGGVALSGTPFSVIDSASFFFPAELSSVSIFDDSYSTAYLSESLPRLLETLRLIYPELQDIRPVKVFGDSWTTFVQLTQGALPISAMGDGFRAAFVLLSYSLNKGLLLLDTPEAFQHLKGLETLSRALAEAVPLRGSQVVLATQSQEFLDLLIHECAGRNVQLNVYRFGYSKQNRIVAYAPLSLEDAKESRELIGADLRG